MSGKLVIFQGFQDMWEPCCRRPAASWCKHWRRFLKKYSWLFSILYTVCCWVSSPVWCPVKVFTLLNHLHFFSRDWKCDRMIDQSPIILSTLKVDWIQSWTHDYFLILSWISETLECKSSLYSDKFRDSLCTQWCNCKVCWVKILKDV